MSTDTQNTKHQKRLCEAEALFAYEKELYNQGARIIVGIDEVGRGSLAGPVTAAAVMLGSDWQPVAGLRDSKQLTAKQRTEIARRLVGADADMGGGTDEDKDKLAESVHAFHVAHVGASFIDEQGIMLALKRAMTSAVEGLYAALSLSGCDTDKILIDGLPMKLFDNEEAIVRGDAKIACIAAASVIAKVARDELMIEFSQKYPSYAFDSNKGYASKVHQEAIVQEGLSPLHRKSFCQNFLQESLF